MQITRLRLNGFKSFVDPTELVIAEGLTGIVGPNGCGKSNLLEAVRWVMGENRPTAMRGDGMEDVIFAGTASRGARHYAEVAIMLDNGDRLAPPGMNDADTLEIARRITRDLGSSYRANGKDVRARDVQMLFADASTGAHSPALVRQGQISELINAKPRNRRRLLEEAAGISGLYQRRHEAELRLSAATQNLARVDDVIDQLAQQIATLARQARQAARYREIGQALRRAEALLLLRRWHDADAARALAERALTDAGLTAARAESSAQKAIAAREAAEAAMPPAREEQAIAAAVLQRLAQRRGELQGEAKRAEATIADLTRRQAEIDDSIAREAVLNRDAEETITRLAWEDTQLAQAETDQPDRLAALAEAARSAAATLAECEAAFSAATEDAARLAARHQSAARFRDEQRAGLARAQGERTRAEAQARSAAGAEAEAGTELAEAAAAAAQAAATLAAAEADLALAEEARAEAQTREGEARAARAEAEAEANALRAEAEAVRRLLAREAGSGSQLLDAVTVASGIEAALGAVLGEDLRNPPLQAGADGARSGWADLGDYETPQPLPAGAAPLADHVEAPALLRRRLAQTGIVARDEGSRLQPLLRPGQRLVSPEGDVWRWDGLFTAAADTPNAAAERLRQVNRLSVLKRELSEAAARAEGVTAAHEALKSRLGILTRDEATARESRKQADRAVADASKRLARAEAARGIAADQRAAAEATLARLADEERATADRLAEAEEAVAALPDLDGVRTAAETARTSVAEARAAMLARRGAHDDARRDAEARMRRRQAIARESQDWRKRLDDAGRRAEALGNQRRETEAALSEAQAIPERLAGRLTTVAAEIAAAEARAQRAEDALAAAEGAVRQAQADERAAERAAADAREARAAAAARADAAAEAAAEAAARIAEASDATPQDLIARLNLAAVDIPEAATLEAEATRLIRARDALGAVNLRAEEDARAVQAEHEALLRDKQDLEQAIAKLRGGIGALNREGRERLMTAFEQVNANFTTLFRTLFGGGEARLVLVESDDPLEAGLEIMCQPPGKRLSTLSLLSGGEQTLTALALIFAVFLANPAPICVLDEVDAPLDDANVTRFCDLLDEMTRQTSTRFLIITHHAVTMARMDRLFGVTMAEQGVSQLVSVDLKRAEALAA